jgi:gluconokinase
MAIYVVMGVSGSGKTTVARMLAKRTGGVYLDADDFHSRANKEKMAAGIPLTDEDRWGWLDALNMKLKSHANSLQWVFLACSALRQVYRDRLAQDIDDLRFIYLKGSKESMRRRLEARKNHFMPVTLLDSQFATLEEPVNAIVADTSEPIEVIVQDILATLHKL